MGWLGSQFLQKIVKHFFMVIRSANGAGRIRKQVSKANNGATFFEENDEKSAEIGQKPSGKANINSLPNA